MSDEEALNALYLRRQELFKHLTEVDSKIKNLETQIEQKRSANRTIALDESLTSSEDASATVTQIIARSMTDNVGLREALKAIDACKIIQESGSQVGSSKMRFRNAMVRETVAHAVSLSQSPQGSELLFKIIGLLRCGVVPASIRMETGGEEESSSLANPESEFLMLIEQIGNKMPALCCDTNGARVVQRMVDAMVTPEELDTFVHSIESFIVELAKDINGNHTLAKVMSKTSFKQERDGADGAVPSCDGVHKIVYTRLSEHCIDICKNRQGCCIIQKCIQLAPDPYKENFIQLILKNALKLVQDPFGNYVVQHILDKEEEAAAPRRGADGKEREGGVYTNQIIRQMLHHVAELSCNKFSSNVIEKCLKTASADVRQLMVDELTDPQVLPKLLTDSFANYVIQTAIATSNEAQLSQLRDAITPLQSLLKNSPYGVKIDAKLAKRHRETIRRHSKKKDNTGMSHSHHDVRGGIGGTAGFLPGMTFVTAEGSMMPRVFTNISSDVPLYQTPVPLMLSPQPVINFNQQPAGAGQPGQQAPFPGVTMLPGNTIPTEYS